LRSAFVSTLGVPDLQCRETASLPDYFALPWRVALHPDGKTLAVGTAAGPRLWRMGSPFTGAAGLEVKGPRPWPRFTPDGSWLVFAAPDGGLEVWDGQATAPQGTWGKGHGQILAVAFLDGGKALRTCREDGTIQHLTLPPLSTGA